MVKHNETCLNINGKQNVKFRGDSIKFEHYFKQLPVPFKIYADFEYNSEKNHTNKKGTNTLYTEKYQKDISCSVSYKVICVDDKFGKPVVLYRGKNAVNKVIKAILKGYVYWKTVMKKHFDQNLVISAENEERFQSSNKCRICNKLFDVGDNKVRDHCHITGK